LTKEETSDRYRTEKDYLEIVEAVITSVQKARALGELASMLDEPFRVWIFNNDHRYEAAEFAILSEDEQQHSVRLRTEADRTVFVRTRVALRRIIAESIGVSPRDVVFRRNEWGKLVLAGATASDIEFSVSHAKGLSVIALAHGRCVGVDIERHRAFPDKLRIAADVFGADVAVPLSAVDDDVQDYLFLQMWTAGEAFVKARGTGFAGMNGKVPVSLSRLRPSQSGELPHVILNDRRPGTIGWTLKHLSLPSGFVGHVVFGELPLTRHEASRHEMPTSVGRALS
jgi:phosphopantetheinyl transferase